MDLISIWLAAPLSPRPSTLCKQSCRGWSWSMFFPSSVGKRCWRHMSHVGLQPPNSPAATSRPKRVHMSLALTSLEKHRDQMSDSSLPPRHHLPPGRRSFPLFDRGRQPRRTHFGPLIRTMTMHSLSLGRYNGPVPVLSPPTRFPHGYTWMLPRHRRQLASQAY